MKDKWNAYAEKTKNRPPSKLLQGAIELVTKKERALDLGAGALNDSRFILDAGFSNLDIVDINEGIISAGQDLPEEKIHLFVKSFDKFEFGNSVYNLINAQWALPFNGKATFNDMFDRLKNSLAPGGIFVGQFFGPNDEWNKPEKDMSFHSRKDIEQLLQGLKIHKLSEEEKDATTAMGLMKHWHTFYVIAEKE